MNTSRPLSSIFTKENLKPSGKLLQKGYLKYNSLSSKLSFSSFGNTQFESNMVNEVVDVYIKQCELVIRSGQIVRGLNMLQTQLAANNLQSLQRGFIYQQQLGLFTIIRIAVEFSTDSLLEDAEYMLKRAKTICLKDQTFEYLLSLISNIRAAILLQSDDKMLQAQKLIQESQINLKLTQSSSEIQTYYSLTLLNYTCILEIQTDYEKAMVTIENAIIHSLKDLLSIKSNPECTKIDLITQLAILIACYFQYIVIAQKKKQFQQAQIKCIAINNLIKSYTNHGSSIKEILQKETLKITKRIKGLINQPPYPIDFQIGDKLSPSAEKTGFLFLFNLIHLNAHDIIFISQSQKYRDVQENGKQAKTSLDIEDVDSTLKQQQQTGFSVFESINVQSKLKSLKIKEKFPAFNLPYSLAEFQGREDETFSFSPQSQEQPQIQKQSLLNHLMTQFKKSQSNLLDLQSKLLKEIRLQNILKEKDESKTILSQNQSQPQMMKFYKPAYQTSIHQFSILQETQDNMPNQSQKFQKMTNQTHSQSNTFFVQEAKEFKNLLSIYSIYDFQFPIFETTKKLFGKLDSVLDLNINQLDICFSTLKSSTNQFQYSFDASSIADYLQASPNDENQQQALKTQEIQNIYYQFSKQIVNYLFLREDRPGYFSFILDETKNWDNQIFTFLNFQCTIVPDNQAKKATVLLKKFKKDANINKNKNTVFLKKKAQTSRYQPKIPEISLIPKVENYFNNISPIMTNRSSIIGNDDFIARYEHEQFKENQEKQQENTGFLEREQSSYVSRYSFSYNPNMNSKRSTQENDMSRSLENHDTKLVNQNIQNNIFKIKSIEQQQKIFHIQNLESQKINSKYQSDDMPSSSENRGVLIQRKPQAARDNINSVSEGKQNLIDQNEENKVEFLAESKENKYPEIIIHKIVDNVEIQKQNDGKTTLYQQSKLLKAVMILQKRYREKQKQKQRKQSVRGQIHQSKTIILPENKQNKPLQLQRKGSIITSMPNQIKIKPLDIDKLKKNEKNLVKFQETQVNSSPEKAKQAKIIDKIQRMNMAAMIIQSKFRQKQKNKEKTSIQENFEKISQNTQLFAKLKKAVLVLQSRYYMQQMKDVSENPDLKSNIGDLIENLSNFQQNFKAFKVLKAKPTQKRVQTVIRGNLQKTDNFQHQQSSQITLKDEIQKEQQNYPNKEEYINNSNNRFEMEGLIDEKQNFTEIQSFEKPQIQHAHQKLNPFQCKQFINLINGPIVFSRKQSTPKNVKNKSIQNGERQPSVPKLINFQHHLVSILDEDEQIVEQQKEDSQKLLQIERRKKLHTKDFYF